MNKDTKHILVIDDDPDMHVAFRTILEPQGYRVTGCTDGPAGVQSMRRERPALLLLDIMMATPSEGFHVLYELKKDEVLARIPVVIVSSIGDETGIDFSQHAGTSYIPADAFLEKPIDAPKLLETIASVLNRVGIAPVR